MLNIILISMLLTVDGNTDQKCIPKKTFDEIVTVVKNYKCLQENKPSIKIDEWVVLVDEEGRIFSGPSDGSTDIGGKITWCPFEVDFKFKPKLQMHTKKKPKGGFRFRFKAYVYGKFIYIKTPKEILDAGIGIDFLYYKRFNVQVITGILSVGIAIGWDITKNFGAVVGMTNPWWEFRLSPMAGLYFGF